MLEFKSMNKNKPLFIKKQAITGVYLTDYHDYDNPRPSRLRGGLLSSSDPTITVNTVCITTEGGNTHFVKGTLADFWKKYNGKTKKSSRSRT